MSSGHFLLKKRAVNTIIQRGLMSGVIKNSERVLPFNE